MRRRVGERRRPRCDRTELIQQVSDQLGMDTCPNPPSCPVADSDEPADFHTYRIEAHTSWYNVTRHDQTFNRSGVGDSRFAPLLDQHGEPVPYVYLAQNPVGALLESVLHDIWGTSSTVQRSDLCGRRLRRLTAAADIEVVDLRNHRLEEGKLTRQQLVACPSEHYACTRRWASRRLQSRLAEEPPTGIVWHSRQIEIAATHASAPMRILLTMVEQASLTAVVYDTAGTGEASFAEATAFEDLRSGEGLALATELCVQLGLHVEG